MGCSFRLVRVGWGERDLVVTLARTMTYSYKWIYNYLFTYVSNAMDMLQSVYLILVLFYIETAS